MCNGNGVPVSRAFSSILGTHACAAKLGGRTIFHAVDNLRFFHSFSLSWYITDYPDLALLQNLHNAVHKQVFPLDAALENAYVVAIPLELYRWLASRTFDEITVVLGAYYGLLASNEHNDRGIILKQVLPEFHVPLQDFNKRVEGLADAVRVFEKEYAPPEFLRHYSQSEGEWQIDRQPQCGAPCMPYPLPFSFDVRAWGFHEGDEDYIDGFCVRGGKRVRLTGDEAQRAQTDTLDRAESDHDSFQYLLYARRVRRVWKLPISTSLPKVARYCQELCIKIIRAHPFYLIKRLEQVCHQ